MDRHNKKAPPPLPLPESDYPPVTRNVMAPVAADRSGTSTPQPTEPSANAISNRVSPTTLRARRFPVPAPRRSQSDVGAASPSSSQAPTYGRSPVTVTPTGAGGGFRTVVSREALAAAGDGSHQHSFDSVADIIAAADVQRGVTVIYPQREGSEVDAGDPESPIGGPETPVANANEDLAQVRVEGYFDNSVGVLIPNDLPKSTLLYVLTASDGRDNMFKSIQYSLQFIICLLHMPSLFSPEMQSFTGLWAEHFYRNYNTIRHGRSLFKIGRGILNLFTAQAVASRLWTRYGDDIRITLFPVTRRVASVVLRVDTSLRALGLALLTDKARISLTITTAAGATGDGEDDPDAGATDASIAYYYSQARMRAHLKQQHRLRAEANTLLTDDVYSHVSKAELGARLPAAVGGSPVSGNVSEGVSPTTNNFQSGRQPSGTGVDEGTTFGAHTRPFYVRDMLHGGSGGSGITGSYNFQQQGSLSQNTPQGSLTYGNGSWVLRPPTSAGSGSAPAPSGGAVGVAAPATTTGLLAATRETVEVPRLGPEESADTSFLVPDLPRRPETAAPTPDALRPLGLEDANSRPMSALVEVGESPKDPVALPATLSAAQEHPTTSSHLHGLLVPSAASQPAQLMTSHGDLSADGAGADSSLSTDPCAAGSWGGVAAGVRSPPHMFGGSTSASATEEGAQERPHGRKSVMEDFAGCTTVAASDPLFEKLRKPLSHLNTPLSLKDSAARRKTALPVPDGDGSTSVAAVSPDPSSRGPTFAYDGPDDFSLHQTSDSDNGLARDDTMAMEDPSARARAQTIARAGQPSQTPAAYTGTPVLGGDAWAAAVQSAGLVPAAIAAPAHWRKKPMQFNPLLMVLLGVRSCSAAIRRFLRDATLISSERFFNTDVIERHRPRIHRTFNYAWLVVATIDLLLNTIRLVQPGWTRYATARQNVMCRCGCSGDDPADVVWRTSDFIARRKTDLVFPPLDLDYGAPAVSYISYFDAADPVHMMPACSHCGYLYKEVTKVSAENEPSSSKPQWLKMYEDASTTAGATNNNNTSSRDVNESGAGGGGGGAGLRGEHKSPAVEGGAPAASGSTSSLVPWTAKSSGAVEKITENESAGDTHSISVLYLPFLMRRVFNYIWLLRCHPNWSATLLLELRYSAEFYLAWKYCFGGFEPYRTDAKMAAILHPLGALAGLVSASVGLLRVIESAPK